MGALSCPALIFMLTKQTPQSLARQFCLGAYVNAVEPPLWRETFEYLSQLADETAFQKAKIAALWIQYGGDLRAKIRDDDLILAVLRKALPGYDGEGCTLYRGECWFLFDRDEIGFCWTPSQEIATSYAKGLNAVDTGGVLLRCYAPAEAILGMENTVFVCDPSRLLRLTTLELFPKL